MHYHLRLRISEQQNIAESTWSQYDASRMLHWRWNRILVYSNAAKHSACQKVKSSMYLMEIMHKANIIS